MFDAVLEGADTGDFDGDLVASSEAELVGRDDAGACQKKDALGEEVVSAQPVDQFVEGASHAGGGGLGFEDGDAFAFDAEVDGDRFLVGEVVDQGDDGSEGAAGFVDLGLGQVEGVSAFDIACADVVADGVADEVEGG